VIAAPRGEALRNRKANTTRSDAAVALKPWPAERPLPCSASGLVGAPHIGAGSCRVEGLLPSRRVRQESNGRQVRPKRRSYKYISWTRSYRRRSRRHTRCSDSAGDIREFVFFFFFFFFVFFFLFFFNPGRQRRPPVALLIALRSLGRDSHVCSASFDRRVGDALAIGASPLSPLDPRGTLRSL